MPFTILLSGKILAQFLPSQLFFLFRGQNLSPVFTFATLFLRQKAKLKLSFYLRNSFSPSKGKTSAQFLPSQLFFLFRGQNLSPVFTFATLFLRPRAKFKLSFYLRNSFSSSAGKI
jgi:predicted component of type VI protein secretion system